MGALNTFKSLCEIADLFYFKLLKAIIHLAAPLNYYLSKRLIPRTRGMPVRTGPDSDSLWLSCWARVDRARAPWSGFRTCAAGSPIGHWRSLKHYLSLLSCSETPKTHFCSSLGKSLIAEFSTACDCCNRLASADQTDSILCGFSLRVSVSADSSSSRHLDLKFQIAVHSFALDFANPKIYIRSDAPLSTFAHQYSRKIWLTQPSVSYSAPGNHRAQQHRFDRAMLSDDDERRKLCVLLLNFIHSQNP